MISGTGLNLRFDILSFLFFGLGLKGEEEKEEEENPLTFFFSFSFFGCCFTVDSFTNCGCSSCLSPH